MMDKKKMMIWWTNQADCEAIDDSTPHRECIGELPTRFPKYIRNEYRSRYGRNGRGRLWVASILGDVSVNLWPKTPLGELLGEKSRFEQTYAGIVIQRNDAKLFYNMPGIITDTKLKRVL